MSARSSLRRLLRAATKHDHTPQLKALLPLAAPSVELSMDSPSSVPLRMLVMHAVRTLQPVGASEEAHRVAAAALRDAANLLELNLKRESAYTRKKRAEEMRSLSQPPHTASPNLAWFHNRMEAATRRNNAGDEAVAARAARQRQRTRAHIAQVRAAAGLPRPRCSCLRRRARRRASGTRSRRWRCPRRCTSPASTYGSPRCGPRTAAPSRGGRFARRFRAGRCGG
jgi:hypothetical protein